MRDSRKGSEIEHKRSGSNDLEGPLENFLMLDCRYDINPKNAKKKFISGLNSGVYNNDRSSKLSKKKKDRSSKNLEERVEKPKGDLIEVSIPASDRKDLLESERKLLIPNKQSSNPRE